MATKRLGVEDDEQGMGTAGGSVISGQGTGGGSQTGTNWTNLEQYLIANKGAGAGMANDVTKGAQNEVNRLEGDGGAVANWQDTAKKQVDQNTKQDNYSQTITNGTAKDINGIDQGAYGEWTKMANYMGPQNAGLTQGYDQVYNDVNKTKETVKNLGSYDGQKVALQDTYGKSGNYGKGFQALDAFAMRGDESGKQALQGFQDQNANFGQKFDTAKAGVDTHIGGAEGRGQANANEVAGAASTRAKTLQDQAADRYKADDTAQRSSAISRANAAYGDGAGSVLPFDASNYITGSGNANGYYDNDQFGAVNKLLNMDGNAGTGPISKGSQAFYGVDTAGIEKFKGDVAIPFSGGITGEPIAGANPGIGDGFGGFGTETGAGASVPGTASTGSSYEELKKMLKNKRETLA